MLNIVANTILPARKTFAITNLFDNGKNCQ